MEVTVAGGKEREMPERERDEREKENDLWNNEKKKMNDFFEMNITKLQNKISFQKKQSKSDFTFKKIIFARQKLPLSAVENC